MGYIRKLKLFTLKVKGANKSENEKGSVIWKWKMVNKLKTSSLKAYRLTLFPVLKIWVAWSYTPSKDLMRHKNEHVKKLSFKMII